MLNHPDSPDGASSGSDSEPEAFDISQRYETAAHYLRQLEEPGDTVLDVGSNVGQHLARRMPSLDITGVDISVPARLQNRHLLEADFLENQFATDSYDFVTNIDVLEHIAAESRGRFISECIRVARRGAVFVFPDNDYGVDIVEDALNGLHLAIHGVPHRWLEEHARYGLPHGSTVSHAISASCDWHVTCFPTTSLWTWCEMMAADIVYRGRRELALWLRALHVFYERFIAPNDIAEPSYRSVVVATSSPQDLVPEGNKCSSPDRGMDALRTIIDAGDAASMRIALQSQSRLSDGVRSLSMWAKGLDERLSDLRNELVVQTAPARWEEVGEELTRYRDKFEQLLVVLSEVPPPRHEYKGEKVVRSSQQEREIVDLRRELELMRRSESWRIGQVVTAPWRMLRHRLARWGIIKGT